MYNLFFMGEYYQLVENVPQNLIVGYFAKISVCVNIYI